MGGDAIPQQFIHRRQGETHRSHGRLWVKGVIGGPGRDTALATPRKRADFDGRLGIPREASHRVRRIGRLIDAGYLVEDSISFREFFWG